MKKKSGLGKGLSALISERKISIEEFAESKGKSASLNLEEVFPSHFQPRVVFSPEEMQELAESIRRNGVIQPILVRKRAGLGYEIIAGERRWRASKLAGNHNIPALILDVNDRQAMEIALIENVQRQNLNILEEAEGYKKLIREYEYTQEQLADVVGKSRSHVTNILRLLTLPDAVKEQLNDGKISAGHGRALLSAPDSVEACDEVIAKNLSVRQTENLVKKLSAAGGNLVKRRSYKRLKKSDSQNYDFDAATSTSSSNTDKQFSLLSYFDDEFSFIGREPEIIMMEEEISKKSGLSIKIENNDEKGVVAIKYKDMSELDAILSKLESEV